MRSGLLFIRIGLVFILTMKFMHDPASGGSITLGIVRAAIGLMGVGMRVIMCMPMAVAMTVGRSSPVVIIRVRL